MKNNVVDCFVSAINKHSKIHQDRKCISFNYLYPLYYVMYYVVNKKQLSSSLFQLVYKYRFSEEYYFFDTIIILDNLFLSNNQKYTLFGYYGGGVNLFYAKDNVTNEIVLIDKETHEIHSFCAINEECFLKAITIGVEVHMKSDYKVGNIDAMSDIAGGIKYRKYYEDEFPVKI